MKFQDYYKVLDVPRDADPKAIKQAYRRLALKWHPDRHPEDEREAAKQRFTQANEAYEVLSDPEKRKRYDRFGEHWQQGQDFEPPPDQGGMSQAEFEQAFGGGGGFSDFFRSMFGEQFRADFGDRDARHARFRMRGADVRAELHLSVGDAIRGGSRSFELDAAAACPRCGGVGLIGEHVCPTCAGLGSVRRPRQVELKIPNKVEDGMTLRLKGLGEPGQAPAEPGDLHLTLRLVSDETYRVSGRDVEADVAVAPWEATFGGKLDVRTPTGVVQLTIPANTRAGTRMRLKGQGLGGSGDRRAGGSAHVGAGTAPGERGDFHAVIRLVLPHPLNERQRELLRAMDGAGPSEVTGGCREASS